MMPGLQQANVAWMNYALCLSTGLVIPLVLMTEERYKRSDVDDGKNHETLSDDKNGFNKCSSKKVPYSVMD